MNPVTLIGLAIVFTLILPGFCFVIVDIKRRARVYDPRRVTAAKLRSQKNSIWQNSSFSRSPPKARSILWRESKLIPRKINLDLSNYPIKTEQEVIEERATQLTNPGPRTSVIIERIEKPKRKLRSKGDSKPANIEFQLSNIRRRFARNNPDMDVESIITSDLLDSSLHTGENYSNLANDKYLSAFKW